MAKEEENPSLLHETTDPRKNPGHRVNFRLSNPPIILIRDDPVLENHSIFDTGGKIPHRR